MGSSCCSHSKEPPEITISKPEENIPLSLSNQNKNNNDQYINNNFQIVNIEQNVNKENLLTNSAEQPFDINSFQNNNIPLSQKEIDDILNQAYSNENNYQEINNNLKENKINNNLNIINDVTPSQYQNIDLNNLYQNQNQNTQNIPLEQEIEKYISSQPKNQTQIEKKNNIDLTLEEILKKQSNQSNTDYDIEEIIKNTEPKTNKQINNGNDLDLNIFFNQTENPQISEELINKLFESNDKRSNNENPLFLSQQIEQKPLNGVFPENDKYNPPGNSPQRSVVLQPVSSQLKQIYELK